MLAGRPLSAAGESMTGTNMIVTSLIQQQLRCHHSCKSIERFEYIERGSCLSPEQWPRSQFCPVFSSHPRATDWLGVALVIISSAPIWETL